MAHTILIRPDTLLDNPELALTKLLVDSHTVRRDQVLGGNLGFLYYKEKTLNEIQMDVAAEHKWIL